MGGELPTMPADPHEPSVQEWASFMEAIATAPDSAIVSMVIQDATGNPTVADFRVPSVWVKVSPRFDVKPPVKPGPIDAAWKPAVVTGKVNFRESTHVDPADANLIATLSPNDPGVVIWLFDGVTRVAENRTWQFVKVVSPSLTDYGWIAADYLRIQEKSG